MITVCEHEKYILQDWDVELTEEDVRRLYINLGHVVHKFEAHCETGIFNFPIIVLTCPHARIDDEFELRGVKFKQRRETIKIDCLKQFEELNPVVREFMEVLVNHLQSAFKYTFHD
jgi:hypothetical protein